MNVGLTGGIACGKSTVSRLFAEKGAFHIDFDRLAHVVVAPDQPAWRQIADTFGPEILLADRTIDRTKLGAIVFRDKGKRAKLNSIVHPAIFAVWCSRTQEIKEINPDAIILSDAPLLIEEGMQALFDLVMLIYVSEEEQIDRLMKRNGLSREEALSRLRAQMPIDEKLPFAQIVIRNHGTLEETRRIVDQVWQDLLQQEKAKRQ
ncbi:MAG: dephospho-CoA kinase [Syntrophus sp. (in: bacteria)]|nr:dephospho-CoA kinase [Syntrophus sp. (in: bacteria)]